MKPVERSSLVDRTEAALLDGIARGKWEGALPGVRLLCQALSVSPPTLMAATARLIKSGNLVSHGPRRRLEIASAAPVAPAPTGGRPLRRILCLTEDSIDRMSHIRLEIFSQLRMENPHWDIRHHILPLSQVKSPRRQWDHVLAIEKPDGIIGFGLSPALAQWAHGTGLPLGFVGGDPGPWPVPVVGFPPIPMVEEAVDELTRHGHRQICLPMSGLFERLTTALQEVVARKLQAFGVTFRPDWHTPAAPQRDPDVLTNIMTRVAAERLPTAIICMSWAEFVTVECFLRERRLRIPADVSVILLSASGSLPWFRPRLTHFSYGATRVARLLRRWIEDGPPAEGVVSIPGKLVPGDSVARPRDR